MTSNKSSLFHRLFEGAFIFSSRNVLLGGVDFLSALLLIRLLPTEDYGRLTLALSARGIAAVFLDLGLGPFVTSEVARCHGQGRLDQVKRFLLRYSQMNLLAGAGFLVVATVAQWPIRRLPLPLIAWLVLIVGIDLLVTAWRRIIWVTFYGYARFTYMGAIDILESVLKLSLLVLLLVFLQAGLQGAIMVYPLSTAVTLLLVLPGWLRIVWPLKGIPASRDPVFREGLRGPGKWTILARPLKQIRDELPVWLIQGVLGESEVALFAVAKKGYRYTALLLGALEDVLLPLVAEGVDTDRQATRQLVHSVSKYALVAAIVLVVVGLFLSPLMYNVIFEYPAAASTYRVLLIILPIRALILYQRPMLYALRGQKYLIVAIVLGLLWLTVSVGLGLVWFGVIGAAIGLFGNACLTAIIRYCAIQRLRPEFHVVWKEFLRFDEFDRKLFVRLRDGFLSHISWTSRRT